MQYVDSAILDLTERMCRRLTLSILLSYPLWFAYVTLRSRFVLLTEALIILTTVVLYVLACDPLPPCPGKVREWLHGRTRAQDANAATLP